MTYTAIPLSRAVPYKIIHFIWICSIFFICLLLVPAWAHATDNERYKAIPMASGGYVFIIDTREGHAWTWNSAGQGQASPSGSNPRIEYQGNVRKNMSPFKKESASPSVQPSPQPERF